MTTMTELIGLVHHAQSGDADAYAELVERFQDMAYGYAFAILNDFHQAEDAAQDAFIEAYQHLADLREALAFPAWFKRIVYKHCDRLIRSRRSHGIRSGVVEKLISPLPDPSELIEQREMADRIQLAVQNLPLEQRVVTTLFYIDGYSQQEIADFLEIPAKTVKSRLYTSRQKLKERVLDMVQEDFRNNALSESFTKETVELAVSRARELNRDRRFDEAERLLRQALSQAPEHGGALKELNRALMHGRVYGPNARWDLLPELASHGQAILQSSDDEEVHRQLAKTLLAIPAMTGAIHFLEGWIARKGPSIERLAMLAWARGCVADYTTAEEHWQDLLAMTPQSDPEEGLDKTSFACLTLVDCFSAAREISRARSVARQGWEACRNLGEIPCKEYRSDHDWMGTFLQAGLDLGEVGRTLLERYRGRKEPQAQGTALAIRAYVDDPQSVMADWLTWVQERLDAGEWKWLDQFRLPILGALRRREETAKQLRLAQLTWKMLHDAAGEDNRPEVQRVLQAWNWERFNFHAYFDLQDWEAGERVAWQGIAECGLEMGATGLILASAGRGSPIPTELVQAVEQQGIASIDSYGLFGWYLMARQAAAAGDLQQAFEALGRSVAYWSNPPLYFTDLWEQDRSWENLRQHADFQRIFREKRQRIGPIYGQLHYFPGW